MITPYWNRYAELDEDLPVEVYRNTTRKGVVYTIRQGGYVVAHADELMLINAEFIVSQAGRKRVKKTGRKNVHAWIRGEIVKEAGPVKKAFPVAYNPKRYKTFRRVDKKRPIDKASFVHLTKDGVFADNTCNL